MLNFLQETYAYLRPWIPHLVIGIAIHLLFLKKFYNNHIQPKFFAWFYPVFANYHVTCREIKRKHFESMKDHKSVDPELRKKGGLRILEIGPGPGYNFEFYPPNSELTVVEVNPFFEEEFFKKQADHPHIKLERFVVGFAEKMKGVPDNSIDIVVSTMVLCSVRSVEGALKEIHRILAPGGKYYFWEHVLDSEDFWARLGQNLASYLYYDIIFGCQLNRKSGDIVKANKAGFSKIEHQRFRTPPEKGYEFLSYFHSAHAKGIATK